MVLLQASAMGRTCVALVADESDTAGALTGGGVTAGDFVAALL